LEPCRANRAGLHIVSFETTDLRQIQGWTAGVRRSSAHHARAEARLRARCPGHPRLPAASRRGWPGRCPARTA